jgi:hypothetical protein
VNLRRSRLVHLFTPRKNPILIVVSASDFFYSQVDASDIDKVEVPFYFMPSKDEGLQDCVRQCSVAKSLSEFSTGKDGCSR